MRRTGTIIAVRDVRTRFRRYQNTRRAIDFHEGDEIDEKPFKALIRAAVTVNQSK